MKNLYHLLLAFAVVVTSAACAEQTDSAADNDSKPVTAIIDTSKGKFTLELYPDKAPETVANFVEYARAGFYDHTIFHRVIAGFMVQGGGFDMQMNRKETRDPINNEADNGLKNVTGTIAMARTSDPHSATSQFFINVADNTPLDHTAPTARGWGYAVFGKVIDGMETVTRIEEASTTIKHGMRDVPLKEITIRTVTIVD